MALSILILFVTSLGLGLWFRVPGLGTRLFLGTALLPFPLFLISDILGLGLTIAAWAVLGFASLGLLYHLQQAIRLALDDSEYARRWFRELPTPALWLPLLILGVLATEPGYSYIPVHWDEFTRWLLWPKLQFLTEQVWDSRMPYATPGYTPGWPLLVVFPQMFHASFNEFRSVAAGVVLTGGLLGLIYDAIVTDRNSVITRILASGALLWLLFIPAFDEIIPSEILLEPIFTKLLIEPMQICLNVGFLVLLYRSSQAPFGSRSQYWLAGAAGVALAAGYFTKGAMILFAPVSALLWLWVVFRAPENRLRPAFMLGLLSFAPLLVVFSIWQGLFPPEQSCMTSPTAFLASLLDGVQQPISLSDFGQQSLIFLESFTSPPAFFLLMLLPVSLLSRSLRPFALVVVGWGATYVTVLYFSYAGCFGGYEQSILASLERYLAVPYKTALMISAFLLGLWLRDMPPPFGQALSKRAALGLGGLALALPLSAAVHLHQDSAYRLQRMSDRFSAPTQLRFFAAAMQTGRMIRDIARERHLERPLVQIITQGSDGRELAALQYMRVPETRGDQLYLFYTAASHSWSPQPGNPFAPQATTQQITDAMLAADIVWPFRLDPWTGNIINKMTFDSQCMNHPQAFLMVKRPKPQNDHDLFACVLNTYLVGKAN
ncbi:hypothetical protein JCM17960_25170 [Magnetospira thiophila]